ncbi:hypothetical protein PoB_001579400 [Plakobranchus ocellatus]|uniref:Uncharacterized protein n=1 Tax=Plakobranchus ocellatus TaxID=259542 RepID=A0AAV3Z5L3_9GAST|nr:hypothetical protein PoB_001579400 [Plakobranchus ocellatus]
MALNVTGETSSPQSRPCTLRHLFEPLKRHLGCKMFEDEDELIGQLRYWFRQTFSHRIHASPSMEHSRTNKNQHPPSLPPPTPNEHHHDHNRHHFILTTTTYHYHNVTINITNITQQQPQRPSPPSPNHHFRHC